MEVRDRVVVVTGGASGLGLACIERLRADGARFVLVEGIHRLEAAKALGEKTIIGFRVEERKQ